MAWIDSHKILNIIRVILPLLYLVLKIKTMRYLLLILIPLLSNNLFAQFKIKDSCGDFLLHIKANNLSSDTIRLIYNDCNDNKSNDTIILLNGMATFRGKVNRATEGFLYTDVNSKWMDGPRVIRFIIEPSEMTLQFNLINDSIQNITSTGSVAQKDKETFEQNNSLLLKLRANYRYGVAKLPVHEPKSDSVIEKYQQERDIKYNALNELLIAKVLKHVTENPDSYYSAYLLNFYKRMIPVDTLEKYFLKFPLKIIYSDFGKNFLEEIFKVSNDQFFRKKFADSVAFQELNSIKTIYDISLLNPAGTKTSFSQFKGNYIVVDFWASWCIPCIENIPHLKKLIKSMKGKPIQFISVSLDSHIDNWKTAMKKYDFPGLNLFDENGLLSTFLKAIWVPRYVIINPDGKILDLDAPQAMNPDLKIILDKLL